MNTVELVPITTPLNDQVLRLAVTAHLARYKGQTRAHTASDLSSFLNWCAVNNLPPLTAQRAHIELYLRWLQEVRQPVGSRVTEHRHTATMTERAQSFGSVAPAYERFRPGYPDELVDEVLDYAGRPVRTALELGAGTGKATRVFARRGIVVTATDPDPAMLAELRNHVPNTVTTVQAAFEDLPLTSVYDLVFAAASLHWTKPDSRWARVVAMLKRDGIFASFGGQVHLADSDVERDVCVARSPFLANDEVPPPDGTPADSPMQWPGTELTRSDRFTDVRQSTIERRYTASARDYVGHLSTVSAYLELPHPVRERVLGRILTVLPERVTLVADITLHLARPRSARIG